MNCARTRVLLTAAVLSAAPSAGLAGASDAREPLVLHVDDDGRPGGDGLSWTTAFTHLQDALAAARMLVSVKEIRVAQGAYRPDQGEAVEPLDINATFELVDGVALRGGYAGLSGEDPDARNVEAFATTLSGDLLGDDQGDFANYVDNSYRVIQATEVGPPTLLEGLHVRSGQIQYPEDGGGLRCISSDLTIQDCRFHDCLAYRGGGIGVHSGAVTVRRCSFRSNLATFGAGVVISGGAATAPSVMIEDCVFAGNQTLAEHGGGVFASGRTVIRRCSFLGNDASNEGGAIYGLPTVEDCEFIGNTADAGGAVVGNGVYRRCLFQGNYASVAGGAHASYLAATDARFIQCIFVENTVSGGIGGAALGGAAFISCRFAGNTSGLNDDDVGGAIRTSHLGTLIANCSFSGNQAGEGGAVSVHADAPALIVNCSFSNNLSGSGAAAIHGPGDVINCAIGEHAGDVCAGLRSLSHSCIPLSCVGAHSGNIVADPFFIDADGSDGVIGTEDDDLRLSLDSPCIDAGDSTALPLDQWDLDGDQVLTEPLPLDLGGNTRLLDLPSARDAGVPASPLAGGIVDMGAHEYRRSADVAPVHGDGAVNVDDLIAVIVWWGACPQQPPAPAQQGCLGDVNADGEVEVDDLLAVLEQWG